MLAKSSSQTHLAITSPIGGDMPLKVEAIEQRPLHHPPRSPIIDRISSTQQERISARRLNQAEFFSAIRRFETSLKRLKYANSGRSGRPGER
jgi:hypothetical protein